MTYRVYHLTRLIHSAASRDEALVFIEGRVRNGQDRDYFEILDNSDLVTA